jgi:hypothetical protein
MACFLIELSYIAWSDKRQLNLVLNNLPWGRVTETYLPIPINAGGPFQYANARSRRELH